MPRSRTRWLSEFLSLGDIICHHELVSTLSSLYDLALLGKNGTSETFGTSIWRGIYKRFPKARYVVVRRDPVEVAESLRKQDVTCDVARMAKVLNEAWDELPALKIEYDRINYRLPEIWQHCRDDRYPAARDVMKDQHIPEKTADGVDLGLRQQILNVDHDRLRRLTCSA